MRCKRRPGASGGASGSASAAASASSSLMASRPVQSVWLGAPGDSLFWWVLLGIFVPFGPGRLARRDNPDPRSSQRIENCDQPAIDHTDGAETILTIVGCVVHIIKRGGI